MTNETFKDIEKLESDLLEASIVFLVNTLTEDSPCNRVQS
jgi:hypothetical protein